MAAGFRVRRVKCEQSIGDKLKRTRIRKKISVTEVEEATKIRSKFILALESDSWEQIPSEVYGRGYLETYAQFLQLPVEVVMKQYGREKDLYARHCQDVTIELTPKSHLKIPRFLLTPRLITVCGALLVMIGIGGGIGMQLSKFSAAPFLAVAQAKTNNGVSLVVSTDSVMVAGQTTIGAQVDINGKETLVSGDGHFSAAVKVQKGVNPITVQAKNTNGKTTSEVLSVEVR